MASFTGVGDNTTISTSVPGEKISISISGTYNMTILFQREVFPGGGAWETLETYSTEDATVADTYFTTKAKEKLRLIVAVDTSGTATATLTDDSDLTLKTLTDDRGNILYEAKQSGLLVDSVYVRRTPVTLTAATTLTAEEHANRPLFLSAAAGFKVILPDATGSGDVYDFYVVTKTTSNAYELNAFEGGDDDVNGVIVGVDPPGDEFTWGAQGTENMVSLGGTSNATGGFPGDRVTFTDIKAGLWAVSGHITQDGSEATPFGTDS